MHFAVPSSFALFCSDWWFRCESDGVLFSTEEAALQHLLNNYAPEVETTLEALSCGKLAHLRYGYVIVVILLLLP